MHEHADNKHNIIMTISSNGHNDAGARGQEVMVPVKTKKVVLEAEPPSLPTSVSLPRVTFLRQI